MFYPDISVEPRRISRQDAIVPTLTPFTRLLPALLVIWLCLMPWGAVIGQLKDPNPAFVQRIFVSEDGLPGNSVRSVVQGTDGLLWVGTLEGLVRFDGIRFSGFTNEPDATLSRRSIRRLFPMPEGEMWIATGRGGLLRWNGQELREVLPESEDNLVSIWQLVKAPNGSVWFLLGGGMRRWTPGMGVVKTTAAEVTEEIRTLFRKDAEYWSTHGRIMSLTNPMPQLMASQNRMWFAAENAPLKLQDRTRAPVEINLTVLTGGYRISELAEDREGSVWLATSDNGLVQLLPQRVRVLRGAEGLSDSAFTSVLEDSAGALWAGLKLGGLDRLSPTGPTHIPPFGDGPFRTVVMLFEDRSNAIWAATRFGGVYRFEDGKFVNAATNDQTDLRRTRCMTQDRAGRYWFGGAYGIAAMQGSTVTLYDAKKGVPQQEVTCLTESPDGTLWAANGVGEILRLDGDHFVKDLDSTAAKGKAITALLADKSGKIWAATNGHGILLRNKANWTSIGTDAAIPDPRLTGMIDDPRGTLWLGSLSGILGASMDELSAYASGQRSTVAWIHLDRLDGLLSRECSGSCSPSAWRGADGTIYFPTTEGVAALQPKNMPRHTVPLEVKFEQCLLNSESVLPVNGGIAGGPGDSRLEIRFNAPSMVSGSKSRYRFRLRGLEESWNEAKEVGLALFRRVPPGEYIFEVDAANCDGVWTAAPARLTVKISPPFWSTIWFIGAMLAVGGVITLGIGWLAGRIRLRSRMEEMRLQNARESERTRIAQDLHDDLGARLTEITLLASLGADDSQSPETAKEIVKSLETKTRAVVGTLDEIVWAVNPRHDTLTSFRDYAAACAVDLTEAASKRLRLDISDSLPDSALTSEQRHHLFLAYREALNNAVKHSDAEQIHVSMHAGGGFLTLSVADDGKGFSSTEITLGEGLKNLHQRLKDMGGDCKVSSKPGGGTNVIFTMPLPETLPTKS